MAVYILVHGAWHGGWCWERIVPLLEQAGHTVLAPDLPGMGHDTTPFAADVLAQWADSLAEVVRAQAEPVILVGHSRGGIVISEIAERVPERVKAAVYVAAFMLRDGESLRGFMESRTDVVPNPSLVDLERKVVTVRPELRRELFFLMCSDADAEAAMARLCPEPLAPGATPLRLTPERYGSVRRIYVETVHDKALPLAGQRDMQAASPGAEVHTLQTDHSPFYSAVPELCAILESLA